MDLPSHPLLRPGVRVTRRGDGLLQLGLELPRVVVVADSPEIQAAIGCLEAGRRPDLEHLETARLCQRLLEAELIVDGDVLLRDLTGAPVHASYGLEALAVLERRAAHGVSVVGPDDAAALARSWLPPDLGREPAVTLVVSIGVPPREPLDDLVRAGHPHLVLGVVEGRVELGPFVAPGLTACLRCVDAQRGESDPRRSLVLEQYAAAGPRRDGVPEPVDVPVFMAALASAVRDCLTYVDGFEPATWSRTVTFGPGMTRTELEWLRHPQCGCAWVDLQAG